MTNINTNALGCQYISIHKSFKPSLVKDGWSKVSAVYLIHALTGSFNIPIWSHICWKNGVRHGDNFESTDFLTLDVDKKLTITDMTTALDALDVAYIIATTKRHTEENHRFRVVIPLQHPITCPNQYKYNIKILLDCFDTDEVDKATKDTARAWLAGKQIIINTLETRTFFMPLPTPIIEKKEIIIARSYDLSELQTIEPHNFVGGNRNSSMLQFGCKLARLSNDIVFTIGRMWLCNQGSLSDTEMQKIVNRVTIYHQKG